MPNWYFERWKPDGQHASHTEVTSDFFRVWTAADEALKAGETFRVRPPLTASPRDLERLARLGKFERI